MDKLFGKNLKRIRRLFGLTQIDLSKQTGIQAAVISKVENEHRRLSERDEQRILDALCITPLRASEIVRKLEQAEKLRKENTQK